MEREPAASARITIAMSDTLRRWLNEEAARRALALCEPMSVSALVRRLLAEARRNSEQRVA